MSKNINAKKKLIPSKQEVLDLLMPETALENEIILDEFFFKGLLWGDPRFGHPEGNVFKHIREIFDNIEKLRVPIKKRSQLRLIALTHDTFKYIEDKSTPRDWSKHHGNLMGDYMKKYTSDKLVIKMIRHHDDAFHLWNLKNKPNLNEVFNKKMDKFQELFKENIQFYYLFFICDTRTGDKIQAPVKWFEEVFEVKKISF